MPYCTECGGKLFWDRKIKQYACQSCGMMFNEAQLSNSRDRLYDRPENEDEMRKRRHNEYLDWWTSSKNKKRS